MSTSSIKKVSAAAIAAVLCFSSVSYAAPISPIVLPYTTNFSTVVPDTNGDTYTTGSLYGQANDGATGGWVGETGEPQDVATVGASGVTLFSVPGVGSFSGAASDVYNANLADHPAAGSNGAGNPLVASSYGNLVTINYNLNIHPADSSPGNTSVGATGGLSSASAFGVRVLDSNDDLIAALFTAPPSSGSVGEEDVYVTSGTNGKTNTLNIGPATGNNGAYTLSMDFAHHDFSVLVNGVATAAGTDIPMDTANSPYTPLTDSIGGISLFTDNAGTNSATFDFTVTPEPTSIAMIGVGGLMLLARRPKKQMA